MSQMSLIVWCKHGLLFTLALLLASCATVRPPEELHHEAFELLAASKRVIDESMDMPERAIPEGLLGKAEAIVIVPDAVKASLLVGGTHGNGVLLVRAQDGTWSRPNFISLSGGSFGLQAGVQTTDTVLLFKHVSDAQNIFDGSFNLGADASVAAGPVGRHLRAGTDTTFQTAVYAWSRAKGLFAGIALDGGVLRINHQLNRIAYGQRANPYAIADGTVEETPAPAIALMDRLEEYAVKQ